MPLSIVLHELDVVIHCVDVLCERFNFFCSDFELCVIYILVSPIVINLYIEEMGNNDLTTLTGRASSYWFRPSHCCIMVKTVPCIY